jgi:hypothetical protein
MRTRTYEFDTPPRANRQASVSRLTSSEQGGRPWRNLDVVVDMDGQTAGSDGADVARTRVAA